MKRHPWELGVVFVLSIGNLIIFPDNPLNVIAGLFGAAASALAILVHYLTQE